VAVPSLVGRSKADADALLANNHLKGAATPDSCTQQTVQGKVENQDPQAGDQVDSGSTISYRWCSGLGNVTIPSLIIGQSSDSAKQQLQSLGLTVVLQPTDSDKPAGSVVSVSPAVGSQVPAGSPVTVQVSKGNLKVVPDVSTKNYTKDVAEGVLTGQGFTNIKTATRVVNDPNQDNIVVGQDPDPLSLRDPTTTTVTIFIGNYVGTGGPTGTASPTG
jgi:serine/threonine-protein kinase